MRRSLLRVWLVLLGAVLSESWACADEEKTDTLLTVEEQRAELTRLREIFASVEKLPPKNARWVEVQAGSAESKRWQKGWLLRETEAEIELLTDQGRKETFDKRKLTAKKPPAAFTWSDARAVRNAEFVTHCREFMTVKKKKAEDDEEFGVYRFQRGIMEADAAVADSARLACWASCNGHEEIARQLLRRAVDKLDQRRSTYIGMPATGKLHRFVADMTSPHSNGSINRLFEEQDPREVRVQSLAWNRAVEKIPYRSDHDKIVQQIKHLESLVAEDRAWKEPTKEEFAKLDVKQKAAYWLHHLRDLNVTQTSSPGMCMVLCDLSRFFESQDLAKKGTPNAAVELSKLGYEIVPQIIAHLEDGRPTRCVGFWRHYSPDSYYTLTYGDCCQQIFEAIALHSIYDRTTTNGYPLRDGRGKECKERAQKWWQEFQRKGEKQMLVEGTKRGDRRSYENADRLVKKFPDVAFESLRDGIRAAEEDWIRSNMLNHVRELKDDRVTAFLFEQAKSAKLNSRVNAIEGLLERGEKDVEALLVAEWMKLDPEKKVDLEDPWGAERLRDALARCGKVKAISAIVASWKTIPLEWRHHILGKLRDAEVDFAKKPFTALANKAVEDLLISCLSDREEGHRRQRTCDLAANALAKRWGDAKLFDVSAPLSIRNRRLVEVQNVWRGKQGLKPLPVPETRKVPVVADTVVAPLLKTFVETSSAQTQRETGEAVERLGIGALPRVRKELAALPAEHRSREALSKLTSRLACVVSEVRFSDDSVARPDNMRKAAERLKGRPLSEEAFVELLIDLHKLVPAEAGGMRIALDRDGDDTGIQLEIRVLPRRDPKDGSAVHLRRHEEVVVDGQELSNGGSTTVGIGKDTESEWSAEEWKRLVKSLRIALAAPPEKQFQVRVEVTRGR